MWRPWRDVQGALRLSGHVLVHPQVVAKPAMTNNKPVAISAQCLLQSHVRALDGDRPEHVPMEWEAGQHLGLESLLRMEPGVRTLCQQLNIWGSKCNSRPRRARGSRRSGVHR